jgi:hypothetical protein
MLDGVRDGDGRGVGRSGMRYLVPGQDEVGIDLAGDRKQRQNEDDGHGSHGLINRARLRLNRSANWGQMRQTSRRKTEWLTAACTACCSKTSARCECLALNKILLTVHKPMPLGPIAGL